MTLDKWGNLGVKATVPHRAVIPLIEVYLTARTHFYRIYIVSLKEPPAYQESIVCGNKIVVHLKGSTKVQDQVQEGFFLAATPATAAGLSQASCASLARPPKLPLDGHPA